RESGVLPQALGHEPPAARHPDAAPGRHHRRRAPGAGQQPDRAEHPAGPREGVRSRKEPFEIGHLIALNILLDREKVSDLERFLPSLSRILSMSESTLRERLAKYRARPAFEPVILKE